MVGRQCGWSEFCSRYLLGATEACTHGPYWLRPLRLVATEHTASNVLSPAETSLALWEKLPKAFRTIFLLSLMKPKIRSSFGHFVNMYRCIISVQFEEKQYANLKQLLIWVQKRSYINTMKTKLFPNDDKFNIIKIYLKNPHGGLMFLRYVYDRTDLYIMDR